MTLEPPQPAGLPREAAARSGLRSVHRLVLPAVLALAAVLRLPSLATRGIFDTDQGRDFLVLRSWLVDGVIPLVGPPASTGAVHHGAAYYYLLTPIAWLSGLDPTAVAGLFVAAGVGAVALAWWLGRAMGGPVAGLVAGLIVALSPTAIVASTSIWNPNLIGLTAALTLAAAWKAWLSMRSRWWVLAIGALGLTIQLHVISVLFAPAVIGLLVADIRRTPGGPARRALLRAAAGGAAVVAVMFVPLMVNELTTGFSEVRGAVAFLASDRGLPGSDPLSPLLIVGLRVASWPIVGLIIDSPLAAGLVSGLVIALCVWRWRTAVGDERTAIRWLTATLAVGVAGLAALVPDLARVIRGLPNDHYHAFSDPIIAVVIGLGVAGVLGPRRAVHRRSPRLDRSRRILASAGVVMILGLELARLPPHDDPNGGWPAALAAAERVARATPAETILVLGLPGFKPTTGVIFPLRQVGRQVIDGGRAVQGHQALDRPEPAVVGEPGALVVVCDRLFEPVINLPCGGPAEAVLDHPAFSQLLDRFDLSPRTAISVYVPSERGGP